MKNRFTILITLTLSYITCFSQTYVNCGAEYMPDTIAAINAPFEMPQLRRPVFNEYKIKINKFGARQTGNCTKSIQKAIDHVSMKGGGTVVVPAGKWLCGRLELKSNVNLHIEENAELHFSGNIKDYLPVVFTRIEGVELYSLGACIYANGANNIAITGKGKIVGPTADCEIYKHHVNSSALEDVVAKTFPVENRKYDGTGDITAFLPMTFAPVSCNNVFVEGITITKTIFWNIVPQYCNNVIIRGVTVNSHGMGRTDGIDIESTSNVLIEYSTLDCGDDCFTIKSGRGYDGLRVNIPSSNIVIRNSIAKRGAGGVTCGSETAGMINNLYVHDCIFESPTHGFYFKTRRTRGGGARNLYFERITMKNPRIAYKWDMLGSSQWVGKLAERLPKRDITPVTPYYENMFFKDITIENCKKVMDFKGIPETPITQVRIDNMKIKKSSDLIYIRDVDGMIVTNSDITSSSNIIEMTGSRNVMFINTTFNILNNKINTIYTDKESLPILFR